MIGELFAIMAPVLVCTALGFVWAKLAMPYDNATVGMVVYALGSPALVFSSLVRAELEFALVGKLMLVAAVSVALTTVIALPALRAARLDLRSHLPGTMHGNVGNLGMPLALFAFGEPGLALAAAFFVVVSMSMYTFGALISAGTITARSILQIPMAYAAITALILAATGVEIPEWVDRTMGLIGGLTIPMMLIMLGYSLASFRISSLGRCVVLALMRLAIGFVVGLALVEALGWDNPARGVAIMCSTMPIAIFNIVLAERNRRHSHDVAGSIVISTLIFFTVLPGLLWFVLD